MANIFYLALLLLSHHIILAVSGTNPRPTATVDTGVLAGVETSAPSAPCSVNKFLGIPFASPPLRWALPKAAQPWQGVRDASQYGDSCYQALTGDSIFNTFFNNPPAPVPDSDDCLYLNVWAPSSACPASQSHPTTGKPVLFWIYGGSFATGTGGLPLYDGTSLAAHQDVIVVTFNYRLNLFGFPGSPDIPVAQHNFGLHDQRFALDWVQRNIAVFGGDPKRVTIFGESAGGSSVNFLLSAPPNPLSFSAAILQSRPLDLWNGADKDKSWRALVSKTRCASKTKIPIPNELECMRQVSSKELLDIALANKISFMPYPDGGVTYPQDTNRAHLGSSRNKRATSQVPVLLGNNVNEASLFILNNTLDSFLASAIGPEPATLFLARYRPHYKDYPTPKARDDALATDFIFTCPTSLKAEILVRAGTPTWRYFYNASFANTEFLPGIGAYHSAEIRYVFGNQPSEGSTPFADEMSKFMQKAWADFAKNPPSGPGWALAPLVQLIGGGATPGEGDNGRKVFETVSNQRLDSQCHLFKPLYVEQALLSSLANIIGTIL